MTVCGPWRIYFRFKAGDAWEVEKSWTIIEERNLCWLSIPEVF